MPPAYVKPYVKRQKNDAADAEGDLRGGHQGQHAVRGDQDPRAAELPLMLHRTRHLFIRQQTSVINVIRAHLAEFGIVAPVGRKGFEELLDVVTRFKRQTGTRGCTGVPGSSWSSAS